MKDLFIIVFVVFLLSCSNNAQTDSTKDTDTAVAGEVTNTINFQETDSIEFIYYPDPNNQKKYSNLFISDKKIVDQLVANVSLPTTSKEVCAHNAKFYLFNNGEVFKTIYYSDSCQYLAYAINSKQHFVSLSTESSRILDSLIKSVPSNSSK